MLCFCSLWRTLLIPRPTSIPLSFGCAALAQCAFSLFSTPYRLSTPALTLVLDPPFPLLFLLLGTQLLGRLLVEWIPSTPPFSSLHSSSCREHTVGDALPTSWLANVSLPLHLNFLARCNTTSVHHYKMPFLSPFIPIPPQIHSRAMKSSHSWN